MTLEKAIEILDNAAAEMGRPQDPDLWDAMCLGIEALKIIQSKRITMSYHPDDLLPGETPKEKEPKQDE